MALRIVFAGTPEFALPSLRALLASRHQVVAVYTQPDRPAGRGRRPAESPVKQAARSAGLPVHQPLSLRDGAEDLARFAPDVMVVIAYGLILPAAILAVPRLGCVNVHASLLPRWRGAAPIQRAIEAGDHETGITIMQMDAGLDTGPMLAQVATSLSDDDTGGSLHDRLAALGADALVNTLDELERGEATTRAQEEALACYAPKLHKGEGCIQWHEPALQIARKVRAFNPWPVAWTTLGTGTLRIWAASVEQGDSGAPPGTVLDHSGGLRIATGNGVLCIEKLQIPGTRVLPVEEFLRGHRLPPGSRLGQA